MMIVDCYRTPAMFGRTRSRGRAAKETSTQSGFTRPHQTTKLFTLPWELRLDIYDRIIAQHRGISTSTPPFHPLYPLLFVCNHMRQDISAFFYPRENQEFVFKHEQPCLEFLFATRTHTQFVTCLTLHLPAEDPSLLYPILKLVPSVKQLSIHLRPSSNRKFVPLTRPNAIYNIPRRTGLSAEGKCKINDRNKHHFLYRFLPESYGEKDRLYPLRPSKAISPTTNVRGIVNFTGIQFNYAWSRTHEPKYIALSRRLKDHNLLRMPKMGCLRYIAVYGRPVGRRRMEFELGVLGLYDAMQIKGVIEGREMVLGYGTRQWAQESRYFDAWIDGELLVPGRDLSLLYPDRAVKDGNETS